MRIAWHEEQQSSRRRASQEEMLSAAESRRESRFGRGGVAGRNGEGERDAHGGAVGW